MKETAVPSSPHNQTFMFVGEVGDVPQEIPDNFTGKEAVTRRPGSRPRLGLLLVWPSWNLRWRPSPVERGVAPALARP